MNRICTLLVFLLLAGLYSNVQAQTVIVIESVRDGISPPISDIAAAAQEAFTDQPFFREIPNKTRGDNRSVNTDDLAPDPNVLQNFNGTDTLGVLLQEFDGVDVNDNPGLLAPPDPNGDVGPNHYVQMANSITAIFDKTGAVLAGPFPNNTFWTGLGGLCETTTRGDPIVLYDEELDRWFVSQFAFDTGFTVFSQCIAVSTSPDPLGTYFQHEFDFTSIGFPDYPKHGYTTDAITLMLNLFAPPSFFFSGTGLGVIDKAEANSAGPVTMLFSNLGTSEFGFVAGDNDGPIYNNMPALFATNNGGSGSTIDIWDFQFDWTTNTGSVSEIASIPVTAFDGDLCPAFREACVEQPGAGADLEAISDRLMHRLQLRDYGTHKVMMANHTVDVGVNEAGIQWYEFRDTGSGWTLHQEGTYTPDADGRWMASIAMDDAGQIALGYTVSSDAVNPSIRIAGQTVGESGTGILNVAELECFAGPGVQTGTARWGDYSSMNIDPDDGTFWFTHEYSPGGFFNWATKVCQVEFVDVCPADLVITNQTITGTETVSRMI